MALFSIVDAIILLVVVAIAVGVGILCWKTSRATMVPGIGPVGFGGWLLLLVIRQTLGLISVLGGLAWNARLFVVPLESSVPNLRLMGYLTITMVLAWMLLVIAVTVAMYWKHRSFPDLFLVQWIVLMAMVLLSVAMAWLLFNVPIDLMVRVERGPAILTAAVEQGLWLLYLALSKRARNTFVRG